MISSHGGCPGEADADAAPVLVPVSAHGSASERNCALKATIVEVRFCGCEMSPAVEMIEVMGYSPTPQHIRVHR